MISSGLPMKLAPRRPADPSNCARDIGGQPRSRPILSMVSLNDGNDCVQRRLLVVGDEAVGVDADGQLRAVVPGVVGGAMVEVDQRVERSGIPPMMASASGRPSSPARATDSGVPPTAIHTGSGFWTGRG